MPTGYELNFSVWDAAETRDGPTEQWLRRQGRELGAYIGTSFLEADGDHFYNTFVLAGPSGEIAGGVRKQKPAGAEGYFFTGEQSAHVIETGLGRIAVGICQENYRCYMARLVHEGAADLILMPFSFPDLSASGGLRSPPGTHVAGWYARRLGVPALMVNKVGSWRTQTANGEVSGVFPGLSAIVDGDGTVETLLDDRESVGVADVELDPARKELQPVLCDTEFNEELAIDAGSNPSREIEAMEAQAAEGYAKNPARAIKARAMSR